MIKIAVLGCGARGRNYSSIAGTMPERYEIVAACDKVPWRVQEVAKCNATRDIRRYLDDEEFFAAGKLADVLIIATQDRDHFGHAKRAIALGYDILLEKPAAETLEDCEELDRLAREAGVKIGLCFVLRYTPFYRAVKSVIESGKIGRIISMHACEGVEPYHQAHSYVRGHWANSARSTPMIVAKCSHDADLLCWFADSEIADVSSYGRLDVFRKENAPAGAPQRCTDGCPQAGVCAYDSHQYLGPKKRWLRMVLDGGETAPDDEVMHFLKTSPWGRCVYHCDNDVVDHQVVAGEMRNGITINFTMTAFECGRSMEIFGTLGSLKGGPMWKDANAYELSVRDHATGATSEVVIEQGDAAGYAGHGGGDFGIVDSIDKLFGANGSLEPGLDGLAGHRLAFLAEQSRVNGERIRVPSGK
jgi:predicted dehydrogenase